MAGEYTVTRGLEAIAFPSVKGQWLKVWETPSPGKGRLVWEAKDASNQTWFKAEIDTDILHVIDSSDADVSATLTELFREIKKHHAGLFEHKMLRIETETEFPLHSGLGSSSALVVNLSRWSGVDPFYLQKQVFGGSAYDIAVCQVSKPVIYWLDNGEPNWAPFELDDELTRDWVIVFPGKKKNSRTALVEVEGKIAAAVSNPLFRWQLDQILKGLKNPGNKMMLEAGLEMWQGMLSTLLGLKRTYDDLNLLPVPGGICKYLGAWGGDMIVTNKIFMAVNGRRFEGMETAGWNDLIVMN